MSNTTTPPSAVTHSSPRKIAFFRKGPMPLANVSVANQLQKEFPELEMHIIDITELLRSNRGIFTLNALYTMLEFWKDIVTKKKNAKECFWRTDYIFRQIKKFAAQQLNPAEYAFSFQMQSLFDASVLGIPHFIYTDHTNLANLSYPMFNPADMYPDWCIALEKEIYHNATVSFTRSHNITRSIVEEYNCPAEKVSCVYAGSNAPLDNTIHLENDNYHNQNILFVGIDWERKGGPDLLAAFEQILPRHPQAKLTIVGCSPEVNVPNCQVVGRVPVAQVSAHFRQASIFCMPTKLEPFGIVFIEALAHKLPIIGTTIGAIPDFVTPDVNGYLVRPGDVPAIVQALDSLLSSPEKCRLFGERGNQQAMEKYNWDKVLQRMAAVIRQKVAL